MKTIFKFLREVIDNIILIALKGEDDKFNKTKIGLILVSFILYTYFFSWKFASLIIFCIGVHESGHIWAMQRLGIKHKGFYFIPFFGCAAVATSVPETMADNVILSIMGPLWGMLLALVTWLVYLLTGEVFFATAAYWQAAVNLFNLIPCVPLDGGNIGNSIFGSISKKANDIFSFAAILLLIILFYKTQLFVFLLLALVAIPRFWQQYKTGVDANITKMSKKQILVAVGSYIMLTVILVIITHFTSFRDINTLWE